MELSGAPSRRVAHPGRSRVQVNAPALRSARVGMGRGAAAAAGWGSSADRHVVKTYGPTLARAANGAQRAPPPAPSRLGFRRAGPSIQPATRGSAASGGPKLLEAQDVAGRSLPAVRDGEFPASHALAGGMLSPVIPVRGTRLSSTSVWPSWRGERWSRSEGPAAPAGRIHCRVLNAHLENEPPIHSHCGLPRLGSAHRVCELCL
jgi:hypothetical protein